MINGIFLELEGIPSILAIFILFVKIQSGIYMQLL